ncbi:hypothetical protein ACVWWG_007783 [Bradyrhizobium sp. LB7.2]
MRKTLRWLLLGGATVSAVASATAQTYDPRYPVCLQRWVWGGSTYFECKFTSWDQCRAAAAGTSRHVLGQSVLAPRVFQMTNRAAVDDDDDVTFGFVLLLRIADVECA